MHNPILRLHDLLPGEIEMTWTDEIHVRRVSLDAPFVTAGSRSNYLYAQWRKGDDLCRCLVDTRLPSSRTALPDPGMIASWVEMDGLEAFVRDFKPPINKPTVPLDPLPLILKLQELRAEVCKMSAQHDVCVRLTASLLLMECLRQSIPEVQTELEIEDRLELVIQQMLADYSHPWHVGELSEMINISSSYFNQLCRRRFGKSPIDMLIDRRIDLARRFLRMPGESVSSVSKSIGFADVYYFSRLFKKRCGVTPTEYMRH